MESFNRLVFWRAAVTVTAAHRLYAAAAVAVSSVVLTFFSHGYYSVEV